MQEMLHEHRGRSHIRVGRLLVDAAMWCDVAVDERIAFVGGRQHGVITSSQLHASGLGDNAVHHRCRRGRLHRLQRGVFAIGHPALSFEGRAIAGVFACGDGAVAGGWTAARLHGITRIVPRAIEVLSPRRPRPRPGIDVRVTADLPSSDVTVVTAVPVANVSRTIVDLAGRCTEHQLRNMVYEAQYRGIWDPVALHEVEQRWPNRPGRRRLRAMLDLGAGGSAGTRSWAEDRFLHLLPARLPRPEVNVSIEVLGIGIETDFFWREIGLCVEVDGPGHERDQAQLEDAWRDALRRRAGFTILRMAHDDLVGGMKRVVEAIVELEAGGAATHMPVLSSRSS